ncbi:hypothetical protein HTZ77_30015 [Nonomuraea sp. SMC257]|uniref:Uncharacterized protein n=1 Tax=Nonomuraea montanisoli TaxID=2741721 RepID=A0A7Y6IF55_9ACTN|nr:hypothetical protein [Nonomuraea montanisoli]NUW35634.1 hypothetical protein [Nonomuraea montanisoli]
MRQRPGDRPPPAYIVRHSTLDQPARLSPLQWCRPRECLADRLPQTFPDVYPGEDGTRGVYPRRYLLLNRQVDAQGNYQGEGAVLLDERPVEDEPFVVTWNTGELVQSGLVRWTLSHASP